MSSGIPLSPRTIQDFVLRHGGAVKNGAHGVVRRLVPVRTAGPGDLAPLLAARYVDDAIEALARGAFLLIEGPCTCSSTRRSVCRYSQADPSSVGHPADEGQIRLTRRTR